MSNGCPFLLGNMDKMGGQRFDIYTPQIETLTPRHHSHGNLADFRGGKDELHMLRGFL